MRPQLIRWTAIAAGALLTAACNTPREAAQSDSAAGGSPAAKIDSTATAVPVDSQAAGTAGTAGTAGHGSHPKTP